VHFKKIKFLEKVLFRVTLNKKEKKNLKILITRSNGFIGYHLVKKLVDIDNEIIGLDIKQDYYILQIKYGFKSFRCI